MAVRQLRMPARHTRRAEDDIAGGMPAEEQLLAQRLVEDEQQRGNERDRLGPV